MTESMVGSEQRSRWRERRVLVAACWSQIVVAAVVFTLSVVGSARAPRLGLEWRHDSGEVIGVTPGGPADMAGIRVGDRIFDVDGRHVGPGTPPFYDARVGVPLQVTARRHDLTLEFSLLPTRARPWLFILPRRGGGPVRMLSEVLRILVSVCFLVLAAVILWMRPHLSAARVASLALAFMVGGNSLISIVGFGSMTGAFPIAVALALHIVDSLFIVGFLALMLHFGLLFPRPFPAVRTNPQWQLVPYAATFPLALLAAMNLVRLFVPSLRGILPATDQQSLFDLFGPLFIGTAMFLLVQQFRYTESSNDRRRLTMVVASLGPGVATWIVTIVVNYVSPSPAVHAWTHAAFWIGAGVSGVMFSWVIVRHQVFEIRFLVRKSIQYALARGTLLAIMTLPLGGLAAFFWTHRFIPIVELFSQDLGLFILFLAPVIVAYKFRHELREMIDRRFFREEYDAHRALVRLASMIQRGTDILFLGRLALTEIERALHPKHLSFWRLDTTSRHYHSVVALGHEGKRPPLEEHHPMMRHLAATGAPLQVDFLHRRSQLRQLSSEAEVWIWLSATEASLLVPLTIEEELFGFLLLGPKRSEEPYTQEDGDLLESVAGQLALTEDYVRLEGLAKYDPLTDALNRHSFYSLVERPGTAADTRSGCVAIVDINDLKTINDSMGHAAGDIAIRQVASNIRSIVRADDLVFRWGGDEFMVVLFGLSPSSVRERFALLDSLFDASGIRETIPLSVSYGIAPFEDIAKVSPAIDTADREMYRRKARGEREEKRPMTDER